jgi:AcrR family transcriptional regulator
MDCGSIYEWQLRLATRFPGLRRQSLTGRFPLEKRPFGAGMEAALRWRLTFPLPRTRPGTMRPAKTPSHPAAGKPRATASKRVKHDVLDPRKLPRQDRAAATVAAIIEAAACILESKGIEGYTTNAVAERAGASIGSLYQYFPNKTVLTRALIAREDAVLAAELLALLDRPEGSGLLHELIQVAVAHQLRRPVLARLLDAEEARLPPGDETPHLHEILSQIFRRCLDEALIAREPRLAQDLFAIIHGMVDTAGQNGESDSHALARRVERAVSGYLGALQQPMG